MSPATPLKDMPTLRVGHGTRKQCHPPTDHARVATINARASKNRARAATISARAATDTDDACATTTDARAATTQLGGSGSGPRCGPYVTRSNGGASLVEGRKFPVAKPN